MTLRVPTLILLLPCLLAACGASDPQLMSFPGSRSPSEFLVAPAKPLETPPDPTALPPPAPGIANRADPTPVEDAMVALGGRPDAGVAGDSAFLTHVSRYGRDPEIRATLAAEDLAFRQSNPGRVLERVFNVNRYFDIYADLSLDQQAERDRLTAAGVPTSTAPPAALQPD
ncbi:DUF3035 domain-containing protein [Meridianimarinicoccus sp. RP-17]|uniref:DUF3035 domain-containing protein n=1 Tax=Meridianimarinicoccus zhengii TaxID=2056810 RepID=UPI000DAD4969|nr:DUF3035 domain-containing protein [Phycocomes zhengii]